MIVKKFYASSTREALRQVRDSLGDDALILSNRQIGGGVEIMAVAETDMASLTQQESPPEVIRYQRPASKAAANQSRSEPTKVPPAAKPVDQHTAEVPDQIVKEIVREIKSLRGMVEGQLAGFAWSDLTRRAPTKVEIMRQMLSAGFSPALSRQLVDNMPGNLDREKATRWVKAALAHNLRVVKAGNDIIGQGGVFALVGPTGSGKTTTVAKLAARATLQHGPSKLALITTDTYRIGAHEQLRIYGKILNVPVYSVKDETDLQLTLSDLQQKHLILIDTVGMSQRDRRLSEQIALLCGGGRSIRRLLLLNATSQGSTLEDVVRAYQKDAMEGCILTKIDEAMSIGGALDVMVRHKMHLNYVTNGQRVPEDLHLGNGGYLVDRAFRMPGEPSAFNLDDSEFPLIMANSETETASPDDQGQGGIYA